MGEAYIKVKGQYPNNMIKQDYRRIKRLTRPMLRFKNFHATQRPLAGIELMPVTKKGQIKIKAGNNRSPAELLYSLAT
jgi:putative transposase